MLDVSPYTDMAQLKFNEFDIIIDALLGIGLKGDKLQNQVKKTILSINAPRALILAIDCPSGININTGDVADAAVHADFTITFIGLKRGLLTAKARDYCGIISCNQLDISHDILQKIDHLTQTHDINDIISSLPPRKASSYKNKYGHVLVIGGNLGFPGAVCLSSLGALRSGAGLVTIATRHEHVNGVISLSPESMVKGIDNKEDLKPLLEKCNVVVIGVGLGQDKWAKEIFDITLNIKKPIYILMPQIVQVSSVKREC